MRTLGVELAHMLKDRGVDTVFGIPGVHNIEMYRGVEEAGLRHILTRHEQGAGFMADGYARATGKPGVAFTISGPGLTNILTPVGQAYSDSVPMLVISTVLDETAARRGQLHQMKDQEGAGRTVADWSETARTPEAAYKLMNRFFTEYELAPQKPKIIHVPIDTLGSPAPAFPPGGVPETGLPTPGDAPLRDLAVWLKQARCPLFVFGGGARWADFIAPALRRWNAASMTTYAGRGLVPLDDPLHFGSFLARPGSEDVFAQADLVITVGTELAETDLWRPALGAGGRLAQINLDAATLSRVSDLGGNHHLMIQGDGFIGLEQLMALCPDPMESDWSPTEIAATRAKWRAEVDAERPGIVPVCDALSAALPANTMVFSDMTQFAYAALEVWDMPAPGLWHHPSGFGTLGYALPAAIGGAVGYNGPVLAIAGDYGFQYTIQELGTAAELGLSLPILLWDNNALGEIRDNMVSAQIAPIAVTLKNPDWRPLAEAYGCAYAEPDSLDALTAAVTSAFTAGRPTIIRATPNLAA